MKNFTQFNPAQDHNLVTISYFRRLSARAVPDSFTVALFLVTPIGVELISRASNTNLQILMYFHQPLHLITIFSYTWVVLFQI